MNKKQKTCLVICLILGITLLLLLLIATLRNSKSFESFVSQSNKVSITREPIDTNKSDNEFRYAQSDKCLIDIKENYSTFDYEIFYISKSSDMWIYYLLVNDNDVWYLVESSEHSLIQKEDTMTYQEILSDLELESYTD